MRIVTLCASFLIFSVPAFAQNEEVQQKEAEANAAKEAAAREAEFRAKGLVDVEGIWVDKKHVADAKKGIFHHGDEVVNAWEMKNFQKGMVRHPMTGEFIAAADLSRAKDGFPLAEGEWGTKEEADKYHASMLHPWVVRTSNCNVISTLPLDTILFKVAGQVDTAYGKLQPLFGFVAPPPDRRPLVLVMPTRASYTGFGDDHGGPGSAHGAFLTERYTLRANGSRLRPGVALWDKDWGPYYVRHATALAISHAFCGDETDAVPEWFHRALGGFVERHASAGEAKYFGKQHEQKGGVENVAQWLEKFEISGDLPKQGKGDIGYNVYQAGLVLAFCMRGGNKECTDALQAVSAAFAKGDKVAEAVKKLGKAVGEREAEFAAFFAQSIR